MAGLERESGKVAVRFRPAIYRRKFELLSSELAPLLSLAVLTVSEAIQCLPDFDSH